MAANGRGLHVPFAPRAEQAKFAGFGAVGVNPLVAIAAGGFEPGDIKQKVSDFTVCVMNIG